jgi:hypothetical protein
MIDVSLVEDGTGIAGASRVNTEAEFEAWAEALGLTVPTGDIPSAQARASLWLNSTYEHRLSGTRTYGREQGTAWPRTGAYDAAGYGIPLATVPQEWKLAEAEATLRELTTPGSLLPDIPGATASDVKSEAIGSLRVEYRDYRAMDAQPQWVMIDRILAPLLLEAGVYGMNGSIPMVRS